MFIWSFVTITEGLQKHQPEMYEACQRWFQSGGQPRQTQPICWQRSIRPKKDLHRLRADGHAHNVIVANGAFEWDDLGSWTALGRHLKPRCGG